MRAIVVDDEAEGESVLFEWTLSAELQAQFGSLTGAERAVLLLLANGASNRVIAEQRGCAERTVANQVASFLRKHNAHSRFELIRCATAVACLQPAD